MPNPAKLQILVDLRKQVQPRLSQKQVAERFGLDAEQGRKTVSNWEAGIHPPDKNRRAHFVRYLWDDLGLRRDPAKFEEVWAVLVEEWDWKPLSDAEWYHYTHLRRPTTTSATRSPAAQSQLVATLLPVPGEPPFLGMHFFELQDADRFFGREALTAELVNHLHHQPFLALVGASGSGKSSLIRAGLASVFQHNAPLASDTLSAGDSWATYILTPTLHPLRELALQLTQHLESVSAATTLLDDMARDARGLSLYLHRLLHTAPFALSATTHLLLVVDQFEELFTLCRDRQERKAFIDNLLLAAATDEQAKQQIHIVITLRADFYAHCAEFPALRSALERYQRYIGAMHPSELRRAIEQPALRAGWDFEPGLVDFLLQEVNDEPGALPLLAHALLETWQRRQGHTLTFAGYHAAGGVQGAIAQTAEAIYRQQLSPEQQTIARNIFVRLTELGEGVQDTRRRVSLTELTPNTADAEKVAEVLKLLTDARLITTAESTAEVAHEALIRAWPTLREWLADDREGLRTHRHLTEAAGEWERLAHDPDLLYRGVRLAQTQAWAVEHAGQLNALEQEFLLTSRAAITTAETARELARQNQLAQQRLLAAEQQKRAEAQSKAAKDLRRLTHYLSAALLLTLVAMAVAIWFYRNAQKSTKIALYPLQLQEVKRLEARGDVAGAMAQLALAAKNPNWDLDLAVEKADILRQVATKLVQEGEQLAAQGDYAGRDQKFQAAFALHPPADTLLYVWMAPGAFTMGSSIQNSQAEKDEKPQHLVRLYGYWMMRTEVTNAQFVRCIQAGTCTPPDNDRYNQSNFARHPVTNVSWQQANDYAQWVGGHLPTEAEWEKACRSIDPHSTQAPPEGAKSTSARAKALDPTVIAAVGSYPQEPSGLFDMAGNVWEWVADWYYEDYYQRSPQSNPQGPQIGWVKSIRGADKIGKTVEVYCGNRAYNELASGNIGFRVVAPARSN